MGSMAKKGVALRNEQFQEERMTEEMKIGRGVQEQVLWGMEKSRKCWTPGCIHIALPGSLHKESCNCQRKQVH